MPSSRPARGPSKGPAGPRRTLWEQGRHPGRLVVRVTVIVILTVTLANLLVDHALGTPFDLAFVLMCVVAPLWVRPRDFFMIGVMPPLLLAATVALLAWFDRGAVAQPQDSYAQAVVSGLAHHAAALSVGYACTLAIIALRQVALRRRGSLRKPQRRSAATTEGGPTAATPQAAQAAVPAQRSGTVDDSKAGIGH